MGKEYTLSRHGFNYDPATGGAKAASVSLFEHTASASRSPLIDTTEEETVSAAVNCTDCYGSIQASLTFQFAMEKVYDVKLLRAVVTGAAKAHVGLAGRFTAEVSGTLQPAVPLVPKTEVASFDVDIGYLTLTIGVDGSATAQVQWDVEADVTASFDGSYSGTVEYGVTCDKNNAGGTFSCEKLSSHTGGFDHTSCALT